MVLPASDGISRVPPYSGSPPEETKFRLQGSYLVSQAIPGRFAYFISFLLHVEGPTTLACKHASLGSFRFARRYLGNRCCFLFLRVLRCFSSPGLPSKPYGFKFGYHPITDGGFPHSDILGSKRTYCFPRRFAVRRVLLRLLVPRHPPCAHCNL